MIKGGRQDREAKRFRAAVAAEIGELPEVAALRDDVTALKADVAGLRVEVACMRAGPLTEPTIDVPLTSRLQQIANRAMDRLRGAQNV